MTSNPTEYRFPLAVLCFGKFPPFSCIVLSAFLPRNQTPSILEDHVCPLKKKSRQRYNGIQVGGELLDRHQMALMQVSNEDFDSTVFQQPPPESDVVSSAKFVVADSTIAGSNCVPCDRRKEA
mmetsp:Transcript_10431/g.25212  ORF Transcript_10431/g.25212 Transcript_10431/m.25212 type:complete len:123 (+) Transcript_10431:90-458(+)